MSSKIDFLTDYSINASCLKQRLERHGAVVKLLACRARRLGFEPRSCHFNFRDGLSPASKLVPTKTGSTTRSMTSTMKFHARRPSFVIWSRIGHWLLMHEHLQTFPSAFSSSLIEIIPELAPVYWYVARLVWDNPIEIFVCANFLSDQSVGFFRES